MYDIAQKKRRNDKMKLVKMEKMRTEYICLLDEKAKELKDEQKTKRKAQ
jgi:hypothetical protein